MREWPTTCTYASATRRALGCLDCFLVDYLVQYLLDLRKRLFVQYRDRHDFLIELLQCRDLFLDVFRRDRICLAQKQIFRLISKLRAVFLKFGPDNLVIRDNILRLGRNQVEQNPGALNVPKELYT